MIIKLKNKEIHLDEDKLHIYNSRAWHISDTGYVVWRGIEDGVKHTIRLHRLIINAKDNEIVGHINRNKLDNRLSNLRICTFKENIHNSDLYDRAKGYYYDKRKKRWTIDFKRYDIRSIYVDSEQDAKNYIQSLSKGETPKRVFSRHKSLGRAKLNDKQRAEALSMFNKGVKRYKIAIHFSVSPSTIGRLLSGKTWK